MDWSYAYNLPTVMVVMTPFLFLLMLVNFAGGRVPWPLRLGHSAWFSVAGAFMVWALVYLLPGLVAS